MNIEEEIFKKSKILENKLIPYGFNKEGNSYKIVKNILDDTFRIEVEIINNKVIGKIYDLAFNEEYTNYRIISLNGEFVNTIREEFIKFLNGVKDNCTISNLFSSKQTNRLIKLIYEKFNDKPDFPWDNLEAGVFRNPQNDKWYGLIMTINKDKIIKDNKISKKDKITKEDGLVEILNIKLDPEKIKELLKKKGYYPAYHMNKVNWLTIILDDTLSDDEIMSLITESHEFTVQSKEWIIPANPKYYDVVNCFNNTDTIFWKQSNKIAVNDIVYLYVGSPYSEIFYKCLVIEVDIPHQYKSDNLTIKKAMKIKLLNKLPRNMFTFKVLNSYGVNAIRGPRYMPKRLSDDIKKLEHIEDDEK